MTVVSPPVESVGVLVAVAVVVVPVVPVVVAVVVVVVGTGGGVTGPGHAEETGSAQHCSTERALTYLQCQ